MLILLTINRKVKIRKDTQIFIKLFVLTLESQFDIISLV